MKNSRRRHRPRPPSLVRSIARLSLRPGEALVVRIREDSRATFEQSRRFVQALRDNGAVPPGVPIVILPPGYEFGTMQLPPLARSVTA